jgi:inhibitor of cysteine peptidase
MHRRRWIALVVLVALGLGLLLAVAFVPWSDDAPATRVPTVYREGDAITVKNGDEFVVALPATPSTGYSWTAADNPDVELVTSNQIAGADRPGASGSQELTFRAKQSGTTTLKLAYARPFEHGVPPAKTATFAVTVTA